jgi:hypothetical protein
VDGHRYGLLGSVHENGGVEILTTLLDFSGLCHCVLGSWLLLLRILGTRVNAQGCAILSAGRDIFSGFDFSKNLVS